MYSLSQNKTAISIAPSRTVATQNIRSYQKEPSLLPFQITATCPQIRPATTHTSKIFYRSFRMVTGKETEHLGVM